LARKRQLSLSTLAVLNAIANGHRYGFEIMDVTNLASGTVYPILTRLDETALVRSKWEDSRAAQQEKRPARRYYLITAAGEKALEEGISRYRALMPLAPARSRV
jgi:PadR family transcriptional regulator PadR